MSAAVIALPTAAPAPVVQQARRGRLPGSVPSITAIRRERELQRRERVATGVEQVKSLCYETLQRAMRGEVTGLATIEARPHGPHHSHAAGEFANNFDFLKEAIHGFGVAVAESTPMKGHL